MKTKACNSGLKVVLGGGGGAENVGAENHRVVTATKTHSCIYDLPDLLILPQPAGSRGLPRNR